MFTLATDGAATSRPNELVIEFQDPGSISANFLAKKPGPDIELREVAMRFDYDSAFERRELEAERLVHDAMLGDQTLFTRGDGIERLWNVSETLLPDPPKLETYEPGARSVDELIAPRSVAHPPAEPRRDVGPRVAGAHHGEHRLALLLALRVVLGAVFERYVKRGARKPPDYVARLHTRLMVLRRDHRLRLRRRALERARDLPATEQFARRCSHPAHSWR